MTTTITAETTAVLPCWDELTDLDKGAALWHGWARSLEHCGAYGLYHRVSYFDDKALVGLEPDAAAAHALKVAGMWHEATARLGQGEAQRLLDLAIKADLKVRTRHASAEPAGMDRLAEIEKVLRGYGLEDSVVFACADDLLSGERRFRTGTVRDGG